MIKDGTKGFLRGGQYAVCLGYTVNGEITLGVLGCPNLPCNDMDENGPKGCLFIGEKGLGAFQVCYSILNYYTIH